MTVVSSINIGEEAIQVLSLAANAKLLARSDAMTDHWADMFDVMHSQRNEVQVYEVTHSSVMFTHYQLVGWCFSSTFVFCLSLLLANNCPVPSTEPGEACPKKDSEFYARNK